MHALNTLTVCGCVCVLGWYHPGLGGKRKQGLLSHDLVATGGEGRLGEMRRECVQAAWQTSKPPAVFVLPSIHFSVSWLLAYSVYSFCPLFLCGVSLTYSFISEVVLWIVLCIISHALLCHDLPKHCFMLLHGLFCTMLFYVMVIFFLFFTVVHPELCSSLALYCLKRQLSSKMAS